MLINTKKGNPILIDNISDQRIYCHTESNLPDIKKFDPDDIEMVVRDKRVIGNLMSGTKPKINSKKYIYDKSLKKLEDLSKSKINIEEAELIPLLGYHNWDPPIYITGATGAGKSTIAAKIIKNDIKQRPIYLFTNHEDADPSLKPIWKRMKKVVMRHPIHSEEIPEVSWNNAKLEGSICLFDDIGQNEDYRELRDQLLEEGRHMDIVVIVLDHGIKPNIKNKKCYDECRTVVLFPHSNLPSINKLLERYYDLPARIRRKVIELSNRDGRYLIYRQSNPMFISTAKTCLMLHPLLNM